MLCLKNPTFLPSTFVKPETRHTSIGLSSLFPLLLFLILLLSACTKETPPHGPPDVPKSVVKQELPANFMVCIDNSASIRDQERVLIRETTMLLADLADIGDRISVITFGEGARLVASSYIQSDRDRIEFKGQVRDRVDFQENYSDIRAGLQLLAESDQSPLGHTGFDPYVIILSDGKLEPADGNTRQAFDEIKELIEGPLANIDINAVVLGDICCKNTILTNIGSADLNGKTLMRDHIAGSPNLFFHAQRLDQLFEIAVKILNTAKGITSLGEKKDINRFKIDNSVESMTLIVRKRSIDGSSLCASSEIILNEPAQGPGRKTQSVYRNSDYQYFDLIVVRNPKEGIWSIKLANDNEPEVLSKIVTALELGFRARNKYYLNESATISAWIFDKRSSEIVSDRPHILKAHLATDGDLNTSNVYGDFHADPNSGQYYLEVPGEILDLLKLDKKPATVTLEVIAQRFRPNSTKLDPWFIRRLGPVNIDMIEPFLDWMVQEPRIFRIPFAGAILHSIFEIPITDHGLIFGAVMDPNAFQYPDLDGLPRLQFTLQILDNDSKSYLPVIERTLNGADEQGKITYRAEEMIRESGRYRYSYQVDGVAKLGGTFTIKSPPHYFEIKSYKLQCWLVLAILVSFVVSRIYSLTGKLQGDLTIKEYRDGKLVTSNEEQVYQRKFDYGQVTLKAKRGCFVRNKITVKINNPNIVMVIDGRTTQKKKEHLDPGDHKIVLTENGTEIIIQTDLYV